MVHPSSPLSACCRFIALMNNRIIDVSGRRVGGLPAVGVMRRAWYLGKSERWLDLLAYRKWLRLLVAERECSISSSWVGSEVTWRANEERKVLVLFFVHLFPPSPCSKPHHCPHMPVFITASSSDNLTSEGEELWVQKQFHSVTLGCPKFGSVLNIIEILRFHLAEKISFCLIDKLLSWVCTLLQPAAIVLTLPWRKLCAIK